MSTLLLDVATYAAVLAYYHMHAHANCVLCVGLSKFSIPPDLAFPRQYFHDAFQDEYAGRRCVP